MAKRSAGRSPCRARRAEDFLRASFDAKTRSGTSAAPPAGQCSSSVFRATAERAVPLFKAGATLCLSQIETRVPKLAPFLAVVKRQLGYPGKASFSACLSPPGSGFNRHFDGRIASTLQIEGTKTWRFSNLMAIAWPRGNGTLGADGVARYADPGVTAQEWERLAAFDADDIVEVLLEPGDLLVLPAGLWHEAGSGDAGSLALNFSFTPRPYTLLVRQLLETLPTPEPDWRSMSPALPGRAPGEVDAQGTAAISAQLARAAALLQSLSGDSAAVVRLWQSFVQNPNPGVPLPLEPPAVAAPARARRREGSRDARRRRHAPVPPRRCGPRHRGERRGHVVRAAPARRARVRRPRLHRPERYRPGVRVERDVELTLTQLKAQGLLEDALPAG